MQFIDKAKVLKFIAERNLTRDIAQAEARIQTQFPHSTLTLMLLQVPESGDCSLILYVERPSYVRSERKFLDSVLGYSEDFGYQITSSQFENSVA